MGGEKESKRETKRLVNIWRVFICSPPPPLSLLFVHFLHSPGQFVMKCRVENEKRSRSGVKGRRRGRKKRNETRVDHVRGDFWFSSHPWSLDGKWSSSSVYPPPLLPSRSLSVSSFFSPSITSSWSYPLIVLVTAPSFINWKEYLWNKIDREIWTSTKQTINKSIFPNDQTNEWMNEWMNEWGEREW